MREGATQHAHSANDLPSIGRIQDAVYELQAIYSDFDKHVHTDFNRLNSDDFRSDSREVQIELRRKSTFRGQVLDASTASYVLLMTTLQKSRYQKLILEKD